MTIRPGESPASERLTTKAVVVASTLSPRTMIVNSPYRSAM